MKRISLWLIIFILIFSCIGPVFSQEDVPDEYQDVDKLNQPREGARAPKEVYEEFVKAVREGDIGRIKTLVSASELRLWNKVPRKMLAMEKSSIPQKMSLISREPYKKYQYNYTILKYNGITEKGQPEKGVIMMVVENGEWKVEARKWDPVMSFEAITNELKK